MALADDLGAALWSAGQTLRREHQVRERAYYTGRSYRPPAEHRTTGKDAVFEVPSVGLPATLAASARPGTARGGPRRTDASRPARQRRVVTGEQPTVPADAAVASKVAEMLENRPPLTDEQRRRLRQLLAPPGAGVGRGDAA